LAKPVLLKRKKELTNWERSCPKCGSTLVQSRVGKDKEFESLLWCGRCRFWIDLEDKKPVKRKPKKEDESYFMGITNTLKMRLAMDRYYIRHRRMVKEAMKVYTSKEYSQEFLWTLIPK